MTVGNLSIPICIDTYKLVILKELVVHIQNLDILPYLVVSTYTI